GFEIRAGPNRRRAQVLGQGTAEVEGEDKPHVAKRTSWLRSVSNRTLRRFFWFDGTHQATLRCRGGGTLGLSEAWRRGSSRPLRAHSSTWSARTRSDCGMVRPRAIRCSQLGAVAPALQLGVRWARAVRRLAHRQRGQGNQGEQGRAEK